MGADKRISVYILLKSSNKLRQVKVIINLFKGLIEWKSSNKMHNIRLDENRRNNNKTILVKISVINL